MDKRRIGLWLISGGLMVLVLLFPGTLIAQITFEKTFGGTGSDVGFSVQQTKDGGYIIAGGTGSYGAGRADVWLIKTDSEGNREWDRTFGGLESDLGFSVQQTKDGGYIIASGTWSYGAGWSDLWLIKTDSEGNREWDRTIGGKHWDEGRSVQQTKDGGYIIAGFTASYGAGRDDVWLIKTDSEGNREWDRTFGGPDWDLGFSLQQTSDLGYIIAGGTWSYGPGSGDVWLIKTDSEGNKEWDRTFGGPGSDYGYSVQQTSDGGYIIAGLTYSYGAGWGDVWLIKTDSEGNREWDRTFENPIGVWIWSPSVQQTSDLGYIIAGRRGPGRTGWEDVWLIKTDSKGDREWDRTFGGIDSDEGRSVQQTSDGGYIIVGFTESYGAGEADVYLIKTDSEGRVGIEEAEAGIITPELRLDITPNPFTTSTLIRYELPSSAPVSLKIYDLSGRVVQDFSRGQALGARAYSVRWDGRDEAGHQVPSGVYFIQLKAGSFSKTRQALLLR